MASCWNFSLATHIDKKLHKAFETAGLENRMINVANGSTISCWVPKDFHPSSEEKLSNGNGHGSGNGALTEKPILVLIHGFGPSSVWQWGEQVKGLLPHFTLIMPDLVFFGKSTTTSSERSEAFQAECVWLTLVSLGIKKFSVVGTSYGGMVTYRLVQAHEDVVEKVVLSNSSVCMTPEDNRMLCERGNAPTIPELLLPTTRDGLNVCGQLAMNKPGVPWFIPNFIVNDMLNVLYLPKRTEKAELLKALIIGTEAGPAHMTRIDKDVLLMWGEHDNVFLVQQAERIQKYLGEERAQLVVLKDVGHLSQIQNPTEWNSHVLKFLQGTDNN